MKTIKFSYTTLNSWASGHQEEAVSHYLGKPLPKTPAMELGSLKHLEAERYIKQHREIPEWLGGGKVSENAMVEEFMGCTIPFSDDFQIYLIGKFDLVDAPVDWDWKIGTSEPSTHADGFQGPYYQTILKGNDIEIKETRFVCYNPYTDSHKVGVQFLSERTLDEALNHIITHGGEMIEYLQTQNLIKDYDPDWMNKPASDKQAKFIRDLGGDVPEGLTAGEARTMIDKLLALKKEAA